MFQPRLGIAWDVRGDGRDVVRGSAGLYYARIPGLNLASARSTNGSIGQTIFRNSALIPVLGRPPAYNSLIRRCRHRRSGRTCSSSTRTSEIRAR